MYKICCYLIFGYIPKWSIIREGPITQNDKQGRPITIGRYYVLQCEQTGDIKRKNTILPATMF